MSWAWCFDCRGWKIGLWFENGHCRACENEEQKDTIVKEMIELANRALKNEE